MIAGLSDWLAAASVDEIVWALLLAAGALGFAAGCAVYLLRHRGEP